MITQKGIKVGTTVVDWADIRAATRRNRSLSIETMNGLTFTIVAKDDVEVRVIKRAIQTLKELGEIERGYFVALFQGGAK